MLKKRILATLLALLACFSYAPGTEGGGNEKNILRLHVIANSDGAADQAAKYAVRDAILALEADMEGCENGMEAKAALLADGEALLKTVEDTLRERGMDYGAQLIIGRFDFPERTYGSETYPAGEYEALRVVLGDGRGQNWWCVLFPPLCILELPGGKIDYEGLDADFELGGLQFSSFIIKLLKSIDGGKLWQKLQAMRDTQ